MKDVRYLVAGLGNPGQGFVSTRHNTGFMAVDRVARKAGESFRPEMHLEARAMCARIFLGDGYMVLIQPQTFMNRSGEALARLLENQKLGPDRLLVVADDIELDPGTIRLRSRGSSGGHNGLKSVSEVLGTEAFPRLRIGVGRPLENETATSHVLGQFTDKERVLMDRVLDRVAEQILTVGREGVEKAMNLYNGQIGAEAAGTR